MCVCDTWKLFTRFSWIPIHIKKGAAKKWKFVKESAKCEQIIAATFLPSHCRLAKIQEDFHPKIVKPFSSIAHSISRSEWKSRFRIDAYRWSFNSVVVAVVGLKYVRKERATMPRSFFYSRSWMKGMKVKACGKFNSENILRSIAVNNWRNITKLLLYIFSLCRIFLFTSTFFRSRFPLKSLFFLQGKNWKSKMRWWKMWNWKEETTTRNSISLWEAMNLRLNVSYIPYNREA